MSEKPSSNGKEMDDLLLQYGGSRERLDAIKTILTQYNITTEAELRDAIELYSSKFGMRRSLDFGGNEKALQEVAASLEAMKTMFTSHEVEPYHEQE